MAERSTAVRASTARDEPSSAAGAVQRGGDAVKGAAGEARDAARSTEQSRTFQLATRAGLICYGLVHALVAWLALAIVFGHGAQESDQSGAFQLLARQPGGRALLWVVVVGLAAMTLWQVLTALVGYREEQGARKVAERLGSAARAVAYGFLAVSAGHTAVGGASSSADKQSSATAGVLGMTGGRALVTLAGLVVFGVGVGLAAYGATRKFRERLTMERMSRTTRRAAVALGAVGYLAKGVAYAIVGVLLVVAAVRFDPQRARGLDAALRTVAGTPYGGVLLGLIALGFAAFAAYCVVQARYRKV
jgi:hypothetical protein